jgi:hypothetical protein
MMYFQIAFDVFIFLMFLGFGLRIAKLEDVIEVQAKLNEDINQYFAQQNEYLTGLEWEVKAAVTKVGVVEEIIYKREGV